jgi:hypothetical protein
MREHIEQHAREEKARKDTRTVIRCRNCGTKVDMALLTIVTAGTTSTRPMQCGTCARLHLDRER